MVGCAMKTIVGLAALLLIFTLVGNTDYDQQLLEEKHYCEMVTLFADTQGAFGWPAYRKEITCGN